VTGSARRWRFPFRRLRSMADAGSPSPDPPPPLLQLRSLSAHSAQLVARYWLRAPSPSLRRRTHPRMHRHEPVGSYAVDLEVFLTVLCDSRPKARAAALSELRPLQGMATVLLVCRHVATTLEYIRASQGFVPFGALRWLRPRTCPLRLSPQRPGFASPGTVRLQDLSPS